MKTSSGFLTLPATKKKKNKMKDKIIYETKYWIVKLSEDQHYLGRCVIVLKRNKGSSLSELKEKEITDFLVLIKKLESVMKKTFRATMFNWTCLMNNAYKSRNPKPHVHWHFRPRYNKSIKVGKEVFKDTEFAHHYDRAKTKIVSKKVLDEIASEIMEKLK